MKRLILSCTIAAWLLVLSGGQYVGAQQTSKTLKVSADVSTPLTLLPADLKAMTRTNVQVKNESGQTNTYEGVLVSEILKRAGVPLGPDLRGSALAIYVLATASDAYQVVFSLGELDPRLTNNE